MSKHLLPVAWIAVSLCGVAHAACVDGKFRHCAVHGVPGQQECVNGQWSSVCDTDNPPPPPPPPPLPPPPLPPPVTHGFDITTSAFGLDPNGFPKNPQWRIAQTNHLSAELCTSCECDTEDPAVWHAAPLCTTEQLNKTDGGHIGCFGHFNMRPVTYEGTLTWGDHSSSVTDDDDYFMYIARVDNALYTTGRADGLEMEFDSEETVDYWDDTQTWWDDFHHHAVDDKSDTAHQWLDGKFAIAVGLAGFDGAKHDARPHDWHVEIHPVYALFVRVNDDPFNPKWAFFVRNWGNEGFCADGQWPLGRAVLQVVLPGPGSGISHHGGINLYPVAGAPTLENVWAYGDDEAERSKLSWGWQANPNGVLLTFNLSPTAQVGIVGDVQFKFRQPLLAPVTPTLMHGVVSAKKSRSDAEKLTEGTSADRELAVQFQKLAPDLQNTALALVRGAPTHLKPVRVPASSINQVLARAKALRSGSTPSTSNKAFDDSAARAAREARRKAAAEFIKSHSTP